VGFVAPDKVTRAFQTLVKQWKSHPVSLPAYDLPAAPGTDKLYFIDIPNAKQSAIILGSLSLSASSADYNNLEFANEIMGGGSAGKLMQILRIEKGYTYGAWSFIRSYREVSPYIAFTRVRSNATLASLEILKGLFQNYATDFTDNEVAITQNKILKQNTRAFESLNAKLGILRDMSKFDKSLTYLEDDQNELSSMSLDDFQRNINEQIKEDEMIYIIVGDKATQLTEVNQLGKGPAIELDIFGNPLPIN
jgi:zinc protease